MKKAVFAAILLVALLLLGGVWFWSLGALPGEAREGITLDVERGSVQVRKTGGDWQEAASGMALLPSDEIRTDTTGRGTIHFFGKSESRLRENSAVLIEQASRDAKQPTTMTVRVKLMSGRVWSRVLRLFDLDSEFSVRTDNVVATVRGTAFDFGVTASGTTVWVSDAAVEMSSDSNGDPSRAARAGLTVPEGFKAVLGSRNLPGRVEAMDQSDMTTEWFVRNVQADEIFTGETKDALTNRLKARGVPRADRPLDGIVKLSERLHLAVASDEEAPALYGLYLGRRLYGIKTLVDDGKSGLAFQAFTSLEQDIQRFLKSSEGQAYAPHMRAAVLEMSILLHDVMPASSLYRLKQRFEDLTHALVQNDPAELLYTRLLATDARLDEAADLVGLRNLEEATVSLDAAKQGSANIERDLSQLSSPIATSAVRTIRAKLTAQAAREAVIRMRLARAENPPEIVPPTGATSTDPTQAPTSTSPEASVTEEGLERLTLSAQPNPVQVGDRAELRLTGVRGDGTTVDLTARATFTLQGTLGSLNGPTFTAERPGAATVEAAITMDGETKKVTTVIQVNDVVRLSKLEIVADGSTAVGSGDQVPLVAKATYSSGLTSIVTTKTVWATSDANVGSAANGTFTAWVNGQGVVTITGTYTEDGVTKSANIAFSVSKRTAGSQ